MEQDQTKSTRKRIENTSDDPQHNIQHLEKAAEKHDHRGHPAMELTSKTIKFLQMMYKKK
ncbi:MAG: hypothetical protein BV458_14070 [Thermoplasmata archaeon M9B2D]|nr:MAG: hypothetical protein BV458_14070 [Thermoplasmata archaeon M9B2D]